MKYIVGESSVDVDVAELYMQLNKEETGKHRIEVKIQKMSGQMSKIGQNTKSQ